MDSKGLLSVVFILVIIGVSVYYLMQDSPARPPPVVKQSVAKQSIPSQIKKLPISNPSRGKLQTWQCFPQTDGTDKCANVFDYQGLPYMSENREILQKRINHTPVWTCSESGCSDVYNFIGKAF